MPLLSVLLPAAAGLRVSEWSIQAGQVKVVVESTQPAVSCPACATPSTRVHGRYTRWPADLPWSGHAGTVQLHVRRFYCLNGACPRRTFGERWAEFVAPYQRQTGRLQQTLQQIGYALGGEAGARLAGQLGILMSPDTLLRQLRRYRPASAPTPRILGVDDFALRRGQRYGTVLVDLERRQPVDLLADRQAETLAAWLQHHPGVEIISRDRAGAYAEGARPGAPQAVQVADRWHLLKNIRETLERLLTRYQSAIRRVAQALATEPTPPATGERGAEAMGAAPAALTRAQREQAARRARRLARYQEVVGLHQEGLPIRTIAQRLRMQRRTVRLFIRTGNFPERATPKPRPSQLDPYRGYLRQRWEEGCHNATALWRELTAQGFKGCRTLVNRVIQPWRDERAHAQRQAAARSPSPVRRPIPLPSPRQVSWWLLDLADVKDEEAAVRQRAFVERLCNEQVSIKAAQALAAEFVQLVKEHHAQALPTWLERALNSGLAEFIGFARHLQHDQAAVEAAMALPWSSGQVEGQINRLKVIKRQMYGRANFDLLRLRVLKAA